MDHFAWDEKEAYEYTRNIISTLNFELPEEDVEDEETTMRRRRRRAEEEPLYGSEELLGLAPLSYKYTVDVKMVRKPYPHWTCIPVSTFKQFILILMLIKFTLFYKLS